jgi:hypothetical protein
MGSGGGPPSGPSRQRPRACPHLLLSVAPPAGCAAEDPRSSDGRFGEPAHPGSRNQPWAAQKKNSTLPLGQRESWWRACPLPRWRLRSRHPPRPRWSKRRRDCAGSRASSRTLGELNGGATPRKQKRKQDKIPTKMTKWKERKGIKHEREKNSPSCLRDLLLQPALLRRSFQLLGGPLPHPEQRHNAGCWRH